MMPTLWESTRARRMSTSLGQGNDLIRVNDLSLSLYLSHGARWSSPDSQPLPIHVTLEIPHDVHKTAETDDIQYSINYAHLSSALTQAVPRRSYASLEELSEYIFDLCFRSHPEIEDVKICVVNTKALLHGKSAGIECRRRKDGTRVGPDTYFIQDFAYPTTVGVNPEERLRKQSVQVQVSLRSPTGFRDCSHVFRQLEDEVRNTLENSNFLTLEALSSEMARRILTLIAEDAASISLRMAKPSALLSAESPEIEITRTLADFSLNSETGHSSIFATTSPIPRPTLTELLLPSIEKTSILTTLAAIALGSNLGDRFANIETALRLLEAPETVLDGESLPKAPHVAVVDTSFMYETAPMYVTDQPSFVNCACLIETNLEPVMLLKLLKRIETVVGRVPSIRNGPRAVDLDILTYGNEIIDTRPYDMRKDLNNLEGELLVPHPRITEREFVLRPLNDMIPDIRIRNSGKPVRELLSELIQRQPRDTEPMYKVIPFPKYPTTPSRPPSPGAATSFPLPQVPSTATYWAFPVETPFSRSKKRKRDRPRRKTYIMATLNATPDSFSDGSTHNTLSTGLAYAQSSVVAGSDIIDIGGYSTRPGAAYVSPEEEINRIVPMVQAIRGTSDEDVKDSLISVDTFRWDVAEAAVLAGANCINDVYAFAGPEYPLTPSSTEHFFQMRKVARHLSVPIVLMHSRGEAGKNKDYSAYDYADDGPVLEGVRVELGERVDAAVKGKGGVRRWLVITDPGLGFSKTLEGNLEVLRNAIDITREGSPLEGYPQLIGASRKSFLGAILAEADEKGTYKGRETRPVERGWATATAVACAVQQGAAVVRAHNVQEMGDVKRIAEALWG